MRISWRIGRFRNDRRVVLLIVALGLALAGRVWLEANPQHNPWAPLDLRHPPGWATDAKLRALADDIPACRAVLTRSQVDFAQLPPEGEGACRREDRTRLTGFPLQPDSPPVTCPAAVSLELWQRTVLDPAAAEIFGSRIASIIHYGAYSCRRLYARDDGPWSEHATGNAIDIAAFTLADGTEISVLRDWQGTGDKSRFLRRVRDGACKSFATVLSPDYNAAHRDHFHFDMSRRWSGVCR